MDCNKILKLEKGNKEQKEELINLDLECAHLEGKVKAYEKILKIN